VRINRALKTIKLFGSKEEKVIEYIEDSIIQFNYLFIKILSSTNANYEATKNRDKHNKRIHTKQKKGNMYHLHSNHSTPTIMPAMVQ
jgi:hypothetical protein